MDGALFIAGAGFTDGVRLIDGALLIAEAWFADGALFITGALLAVKVGFFKDGTGGFGCATGILPAGGIREKVVPDTFAGTGEDGCSFNTTGADGAEATGGWAVTGISGCEPACFAPVSLSGTNLTDCGKAGGF